MPTLTISLNDLGKELKKIPERHKGAILRAMSVTGKVDALRWIQWSVMGGDYVGDYRVPVDTADYARSWRSTDLGSSVFVWSDANPPEKAGVIEEGRRPAPIPIRPLAEWVRRKFGTDEKESLSIAFAISKKASKERRVGLRVLARAYPKIADAAVANVRRELRKVKPGT